MHERSPLRILIADDNDRVRRGLSELLSLDPLCTVCGQAANGAEALQMAESLQPDLILLDISMPDTNGLEVARKVRTSAPGIKILVTSQHDAGQILSRALAAGADACVDKSRLSTDLLPAVKLLCPR
jgi:DNA-binding NarL/FixJ family response regulator